MFKAVNEIGVKVDLCVLNDEINKNRVIPEENFSMTIEGSNIIIYSTDISLLSKLPSCYGNGKIDSNHIEFVPNLTSNHLKAKDILLSQEKSLEHEGKEYNNVEEL